MIQGEDFEQRLEGLNWTLYRLAKEMAEYRSNGGEVAPASRYHSSIGKAIENPRKSRLETIEDIVQVLNGELRIIWEPDRVVTIRLEDETIEALKQRGENEGKSINEVARQLLVQALSGIPTQKPTKLTELVFDGEPKIYRSFHPAIAAAYSSVHRWLENIPEAEGYKELDYSQEIARSLRKQDLQSIAFQFYTLFPFHYFQAGHVLDKVINSARFLNRIKSNPHIYLVDVGCALGAGTAAFIEKILTLSKEKTSSKPIEIIAVGIDTNLYGYAVYKKLMEEIQKNVSEYNINLKFKAINEPLAQATLRTISYFQSKLNDGNASVNVLPHLFITQLDVASSLTQEELPRKEREKKLKALGIEPDTEAESNQAFWQEESLTFKRLLEEIPAENLSLTTIGTKNLEEFIQDQTDSKQISENFEEIHKAIKHFLGTHKIKVALAGEQKVYFTNPIDGYWYDDQQSNYSNKFYASFATITNLEVEEDIEWKKLISYENIELAWAKARRNFLSDSFYDEAEIRLFEENLEENLNIIIEKLYDQPGLDHVLPDNYVVNYLFPKSTKKGRPKQLNRLEEEIIAIAILQTVGKKIYLNLYSYKLKPEFTEDLYRPYFKGYIKFLEDSEKSALFYPNGAVIRTDIKSFYTNIIQKELNAILEEEINNISHKSTVNSKRIQWLLKKSIEQKIDGHSSGKGLKQGTLTSGFYANLYLKSVDYYFQNNRKWKNIIKYHRYVDDLIIVVRDPAYLDQIEAELKEKLSQLELELNQDKTEYYSNINEFIKTIQLDNELTELYNKINNTINSLWLIDNFSRANFEVYNSNNNNNLWWNDIKLYQQCLTSIGIFIQQDQLSRKINQSLVNPNFFHKSEVIQLNFPSLPSENKFIAISAWKEQFQKLNSAWLTKKENIKEQVNKVFFDSIKKIKELSQTNKFVEKKQKHENNITKKYQETRIRWAVNQLMILGFDQVKEEVIYLICESFVIRNLLEVITHLAYQGHTDAIQQLWDYYKDREEKTDSYLRAVIIEAFRFLPILEPNKFYLIFNLSTEAKSDIEKLKATETWLYLGDRAQPFVQKKHIKAIVNALENDPPPFRRLKKNYILILGMYDISLLENISLSPEEKNDYLIQDALRLSEEGRVSEIFQKPEPARVRQYYNTKQTSTSKDKSDYLSPF